MYWLRKCWLRALNPVASLIVIVAYLIIRLLGSSVMFWGRVNCVYYYNYFSYSNVYCNGTYFCEFGKVGVKVGENNWELEVGAAETNRLRFVPYSQPSSKLYLKLYRRAYWSPITLRFLQGLITSSTTQYSFSSCTALSMLTGILYRKKYF